MLWCAHARLLLIHPHLILDLPLDSVPNLLGHPSKASRLPTEPLLRLQLHLRVRVHPDPDACIPTEGLLDHFLLLGRVHCILDRSHPDCDLVRLCPHQRQSPHRERPRNHLDEYVCSAHLPWLNVRAFRGQLFPVKHLC